MRQDSLGRRPDFAGLENWDVFADLDADSSLTTRYVHGDGVDELAARIDADADAYIYVTDRLGSVISIATGGDLLGTLTYDGYGNLLSNTVSGLDDRMGWTGRPRDEETGLQDNREREYDPQMAPWPGSLGGRAKREVSVRQLDDIGREPSLQECGGALIGVNMNSQQSQNRASGQTLSGLIEEAKAIIHRLRSRFKGSGPTISPPDLTAPYPALNQDRDALAQCVLHGLLESLGTFEKQAGPDLDELEVRLRHVGAVKDRVTHLEEQAERHGPPHSHGFAQKLQKARQEFARVARSGIETEIASLNAKIQSLVVALNEQIAGARQKLHALGVEQRDENERTAPPRPEPLKQSKAQVKEIWRFNPCSQWPERTEIPVEESTTGVSKNPKGWREALVDPDPYVRVEAIKAAGKSGKPDLVPDLIQALYREANEEMICRLVLALGEIGDPAAVPALLNQARHPDAYVRIAVAWALGQMGDPRGIPALQELARDHSRPTCCIKNGMRPACERKISEEARDALAKIRKP